MPVLPRCPPPPTPSQLARATADPMNKLRRRRNGSGGGGGGTIIAVSMDDVVDALTGVAAPTGEPVREA